MRDPMVGYVLQPHTGVGCGKSTATCTGKVAKQAATLGKSAKDVAYARRKAPKYYRVPSLGKDSWGKQGEDVRGPLV